MDIKSELIKSEIVCDWGMKYYSVIGFGNAKFIGDLQEKKEALKIIMQKYSRNNKSFEYSERTLNKTSLIKVKITEITGKKSGY